MTVELNSDPSLAPLSCLRTVTASWHLMRLAIFAWTLLQGPCGWAATSEMGWPEATGQLASMRTKAETCMALLKRYGSPGQKAQGQLSYGDARSDVDAVITGLITALAVSGQPAALPDLQEKLAKGSSGLVSFCASATAVLPSNDGKKGLVEEIAKAALDPLINSVSNGVASLYNNYRADTEMTRKTIQTQLEAARWLEFDKVPPAQ